VRGGWGGGREGGGGGDGEGGSGGWELGGWEGGRVGVGGEWGEEVEVGGGGGGGGGGSKVGSGGGGGGAGRGGGVGGAEGGEGPRRCPFEALRNLQEKSIQNLKGEDLRQKKKNNKRCDFGYSEGDATCVGGLGSNSVQDGTGEGGRKANPGGDEWHLKV